MIVSFIFRIHCIHLTGGLQTDDGLTSSGQGVKPKSNMKFRSMGTRSNTTTAAGRNRRRGNRLMMVNGVDVIN
jgi:hypothetical protein